MYIMADSSWHTGEWHNGEVEAWRAALSCVRQISFGTIVYMNITADDVPCITDRIIDVVYHS